MKSKTSLTTAIALAVAYCFSSTPPLFAARFIPLGVDFPGIAKGITANGRFIYDSEGRVWSAETGVFKLGGADDLHDVPVGGLADDGRTAVGWYINETGIWREGEGFVSLGEIEPGGQLSAEQISRDGKVVVGKMHGMGTGWVPFRWTEESGLVDLGFPGWANDATPDGNVVVGWAGTGAVDHIAFRWTAETGTIRLGDLPGGSNESDAKFVSADGQVVVGDSHSFTGVEDGGQLFRWTAETGMVGLGTLGGQSSRPFGISDDGSLIVGISNTGANPPNAEAFIWDETHGMRTFQDYLVNELGLDGSDRRMAIRPSLCFWGRKDFCHAG